MKGKPIEPGCLALVLHSPNTRELAGRTVRVVRRAATQEFFFSLDIPPVAVMIDGDFVSWVIESPTGELLPIYPTGGDRLLFAQVALVQSLLIRIDGDAEPSDEETDESLLERAEY